MLAVEVTPDRRDLRAAVGHEGREAGECPLLKKIFVLLGDSLRHEVLQELNTSGIIDACRGTLFVAGDRVALE